jgi:hypothetical protein
MATQKRSQKIKKHHHSFPWHKAIYIFCAVIIGLVIAIQVTLDVHFWRSTRYPSNDTLVSMIIQAVKATTKPAVTEPVSKKVYITDASLVLPPYPVNMPNIEYSYTPSFDGTDAEANVTVTNAVSVGTSKLLNAQAMGAQDHDPGKLFTAVPDLQVCVRGVHIVFGTKTTYKHLQFTKQLTDGREIHVYTEQRSCAYDLQPLVTYLRDVDSY